SQPLFSQHTQLIVSTSTGLAPRRRRAQLTGDLAGNERRKRENWQGQGHLWTAAQQSPNRIDRNGERCEERRLPAFVWRRGRAGSEQHREERRRGDRVAQRLVDADRDQRQ